SPPDRRPRHSERTRSRHQSPRAKTPLPIQPTFHTPRRAAPAAAPAARASGNARHDRADQTAHAAPGTIAWPCESATDPYTHADTPPAPARVAPHRPPPPTPRLPVRLPADGAARQAPGSEP